jgi:hypothetical protein
MKNIFLSYRHSDTDASAGRIYDRLVQLTPRNRVFFDVSAVGPGINFEREIVTAMQASEIALFFIGDKWLGRKTSTGSARIWDDSDYVRAEARAALAIDNIKILPVLVGGAPMPRRDQLPPDIREIAARNALFLRHERFDDDAERIVAAIFGNSIAHRSVSSRNINLRSILYGLIGAAFGIVVVTIFGIVNQYVFMRPPLSMSIGLPMTIIVLLCGPTIGFVGGIYYSFRV